MLNRPKKAGTAPHSRLIVAITLLTVLLSATVAGAIPAGADVRESLTKTGRVRGLRLPSYVPGQILVEFKQSSSSGSRARSARSVGAKNAVRRLGLGREKDTYVYQLKAGRSVTQAVRALESDDAVVAAAPNYIRRTSSIPNDPGWSNQWGLRNTGQTIEGSVGISDADIDAPEAWDVGTGDSTTVAVAVIDSGIDHTHPDLSSKLWDSGDAAGNQTDDDANGYVDDTRGYNFAGISQYSANALEYVGYNNTNPVAQSIKSTGQPLTHVGILLAKIGAPSSNIVISVRASLVGPDLATATIAPGEVANYPSVQEVYKELNVPVTLTSGAPYYLVFSATSSNSSNYYLMADNYSEMDFYLEDPYRDGQEYWWDGDSWIPFASDDWCFRTNPNASPRDDNGHGTHVAGIVGAGTNNAVGVAGVAPEARMMALKAGDSSGSLTSADIIDAIHYAADNGAKVINMSFAGPSFSSLEQEAVNYAAGKGVTLLAAVGNDGTSAINYPAAYDNVIGVGATTNRDQRASFSNFNSTVDVSAPGMYVYSTMPTYPAGLNSYGYAQGYDFLSGTSMASPMAAGVAALVIAESPGLTPQEVEQVMESTADDLGSPGRDNSFGHGRLNAAAAVAAVGRPPITTATSLPPAANGDNGWFKTMPNVSLSVDEPGATTYFGWNTTDTGTFSEFVDDIAPPEEGTQTLYYYSVDTDDNTEILRSKQFKVDTGLPTDPTSLISTSHTIESTPTDDRTVDVRFSGAADTVSGVGGYSTSWTKDTTGTPPQVASLIHTGTTQTVTSQPLSDGQWYLNLSTKDVAGNWTSTVHLGPFSISGPATIDITTDPDVGTGGWFKTVPAITLTPDETAAVHYQWDSTDTAGWVGDDQLDSSVTIAGLEGEHTLYYYSVDSDDNTSTVQTRLFKVDTALPTATINAPRFSTDLTNKAIVPLTWSGADTGGSGLSGRYQIQYMIKSSAYPWQVWKTVTGTSVNFPVRPGRYYYFRVKAEDNAGNWGAWSPYKRTIVPYNESQIRYRSGFNGYYSNASSAFYLGTVRYSRTAGEWMSFTTNTTRFAVIGTAGQRSKFDVYVDGRFIRTVDPAAKPAGYHKVLYEHRFSSVGRHTIKIVNKATAGRIQFDMDGIGAEL